jgi:translation elongation factor EF-Tu-like GTPase
MWILQFLPDWIFLILLVLGVATYLITKLTKFLPQAQLLQYASIAVVVFSVYMLGAVSNNNAWLARVKELETKVAEAEAKSASANTNIVEKTVFKTQTIRERAQDVIKYVDREIVKYDTACVIPQEFIQAHNRAAEAPK